MAMDVILPYVAWITLLAFLTDFALARLNRWAFLGTTQPAGTDYERSRTSLRFSRVGKEYGSHIVLESISTQVQEGEFVSLVGTSGCGKALFKNAPRHRAAQQRRGLLGGKPLAAEPGPDRGIVSQSIRSSPPHGAAKRLGGPGI